MGIRHICVRVPRVRDRLLLKGSFCALDGEMKVAHGQCYFDFSELELNGESDVSLRPIIELLEHKVPLLPPG